MRSCPATPKIIFLRDKIPSDSTSKVACV